MIIKLKLESQTCTCVNTRIKWIFTEFSDIIPFIDFNCTSFTCVCIMCIIKNCPNVLNKYQSCDKLYSITNPGCKINTLNFDWSVYRLWLHDVSIHVARIYCIYHKFGKSVKRYTGMQHISYMHEQNVIIMQTNCF